MLQSLLFVDSGNVPGILLNSIHVSSHFRLPRTLKNGAGYYSHFMDEEMETWAVGLFLGRRENFLWWTQLHSLPHQVSCPCYIQATLWPGGDTSCQGLSEVRTETVGSEITHVYWLTLSVFYFTIIGLLRKLCQVMISSQLLVGKSLYPWHWAEDSSGKFHGTLHQGAVAPAGWS